MAVADGVLGVVVVVVAVDLRVPGASLVASLSACARIKQVHRRRESYTKVMPLVGLLIVTSAKAKQKEIA